MRKKLKNVLSFVLAIVLFFVELESLFEITLYNAKEIENSKEDTYSRERLLEPTEIKVENTLEPKNSINKKEDKNKKKEVKVYSANKEHHIKDSSRIEREFVLDFDDDEYDAITVSSSNTAGIQIEEQDIVTQKKDKKVKISFEPKNSKLKDKNKDVRNIQEESVSIDIEMWKNDAIAQKEKQDVWVLSTPYGEFVSDVDQIINKRNYNKYLLENGIIDEATYEDLDREFHCYSDSSASSVNDASSESEVMALSTTTAVTSYKDYVEIKYSISEGASGETLTVGGVVYWYDSGSDMHKAEEIKIEIWDDDVAFDDKIATIKTTSSGYFSCTFSNETDLIENGRDIYLKVYPGNDDTMVYDCGNLFTISVPTLTPGVTTVPVFYYEPYYFTTSVSSNIMKSVTGCYSYAPSGSVVAKTFSIGNALYYGRKYEMYINGGACLNNTPVTAHYPLVVIPTSFTLPVIDKGTMFIADGDYGNWGTILHEYGHAVEDKLDIFVGYDKLFTYEFFNHEADKNLTDFYKGNKEKALQISWNEGWASYYSLCVQRKYNLTNYDFPGTSLTKIWNYNIVSGNGYGEDHELAIAGVLLNSVIKETFTEQDLWNIVKENTPQRFEELVEILVAELIGDATTGEGFSENEINIFLKVLEEKNIAASGLSNKYGVSSYAPTFTWEKPSVSGENENGFDFQFQYNLVIVCYDPVYSYISPTITETSYTPSAEEWAEIVDACPSGFYWTIRTTENHTPISSGYFSQFSKMSSPEEMVIASNSRYKESRVYLGAGAKYDYRISFATSGNKVIQTFGSQDTVLELYSSNGELLLGWWDTDNHGYDANALISYNFAANTDYIVRVRIYDDSTAGYVKLAVVPTYYHDSYNSAYGPYGLSTVSWSLSNDRVALFRYKFSSAGNVTFTMSSSTNTDTYLYIIDPTSTSLISKYTGSNYNAAGLYDDDSGEGTQAQLTKYITANKEYLVIISFYNPHTMSGKFSIKASK